MVIGFILQAKQSIEAQIKRIMNARLLHHRKQLFFSLCLAWFMQGCDANGNTTEKPQPGSAKDIAQAKNLLIFPNELQTADQEVNNFLRHAMTTAASGDYDTFRSLWSTKTEPLSKDEFDQGWQAVKAIRILTIEKIKVARNEKHSKTDPVVAYLVHARIEFDQLARVGKSIENREAICMIQYEQNQWRLANAPATMRTWLREKAATLESPNPQKKLSGASQTISGS